MSSPGLPHPSGHVVVIDEEPGPDGFAVVCIPHGPVGAWERRVDAFLHALEHDEEHGGTSAR